MAKKKKWDSYGDYLKSAEWQELREEVIARDSDTCQVCGDDTAEELHCHHWKYPDDWNDDSSSNIVRICEPCHTEIHSSRYKAPPTNTFPEYLIWWLDIKNSDSIIKAEAEILAQIIKNGSLDVYKKSLIISKGKQCNPRIEYTIGNGLYRLYSTSTIDLIKEELLLL